MRRYDAMVAPPPEQWLALDDQRRIDLVVAYHRRINQRIANETAHALLHVVVENQIADPELPVRRTAKRLQSEGLDRHQAIHAIGSVLAGYLNGLMRKVGADQGKPAADVNTAYFGELERLTAEAWLRSA